MTRGLEQLDHSIAKQVQVFFDGSPLESRVRQIPGDVSTRLRLIVGAGGGELARVHDDRRVREVPKRARVIHVEVRLHDVADRICRDAEAAQLLGAMLRLGHVRAKVVRQGAPVSAGVSGNRERIATVDQDVTLRVADQKERHGRLDPASLESAAAEEEERDPVRHIRIVDAPRPSSPARLRLWLVHADRDRRDDSVASGHALGDRPRAIRGARVAPPPGDRRPQGRHRGDRRGRRQPHGDGHIGEGERQDEGVEMEARLATHLEHHLFAGIPWYHLRRAHQALAPQWKELEAPVEPGYWSVLRRLASARQA